jgi:endogenous inhibitor of DNA gyrase (YacG/DUF329 family)
MSTPSNGCPICGKPGVAGFAPFCGRRCADIDLGRWLKGSYAIPGAVLEPGEEAPAGPARPANEDDPE